MKEPRLQGIFQKQDDVMRDHLEQSPFAVQAYALISDAEDVTVRIIQSMRFSPRKQDAVATLAIACLSPVVVALRVGLWGDLPESLSVLRGGLETCTQLKFVVGKRMYDTASSEMDRKFNQISFKKVVRELGQFGEMIRKLHDKISEVAAHATATRLKWDSYEHQGATFFRAGFARDASKAEMALFYCMYVCIVVLDALEEAYQQDSLQFDWGTELQDLRQRFSSLRTDFRGRFPMDAA